MLRCLGSAGPVSPWTFVGFGGAGAIAPCVHSCSLFPSVREGATSRCNLRPWCNPWLWRNLWRKLYSAVCGATDGDLWIALRMRRTRLSVTLLRASSELRLDSISHVRFLSWGPIRHSWVRHGALLWRSCGALGAKPVHREPRLAAVPFVLAVGNQKVSSPPLPPAPGATTLAVLDAF